MNTEKNRPLATVQEGKLQIAIWPSDGGKYGLSYSFTFSLSTSRTSLALSTCLDPFWGSGHLLLITFEGSSKMALLLIPDPDIFLITKALTTVYDEGIQGDLLAFGLPITVEADVKVGLVELKKLG